MIIERATQRQIGWMGVWISSAEDLIIQKAITKRIKDWQDVEGLLITQYKKLDYEYIEGRLIQFAEALEQPDLLENYHKLLDKAANTNNSYS